MMVCSARARKLAARYPLPVWVVLVATVALSTGALCWDPTGSARPQSHWMSAAEARDEYRLEAKRLRLAPGWRWPNRLAIAACGPDGAPMCYESGFGAGQADIYWFCTWGSVVIADTGSKGDREHALRELRRIKDTALFTRHLEDNLGSYDDMIDSAARGEVSALRAYVSANCSCTHD